MDAILLNNIHQHFSAIHISIFRLMRSTVRIKLKYVWITARYKIMVLLTKHHVPLNCEIIYTYFNYICILVLTTLKMVWYGRNMLLIGMQLIYIN
jgi:hypothetical protein